MIERIDELLTSVLRDALAKSGIPGVEVTFGPPTPRESKVPSLNLYLHAIEENTAVRETGRELARIPGGSDGAIGRPPMTVNLRYILTASGPDSSVAHRVLSDSLVALLRSPVYDLDTRPHAVQEPVEHAQLIVAQPSRDEATSLWLALGLPLQPSLNLVASVRFRPYETKVVRLVREFVVGLGQGMDQTGLQRNITTRALRVSAAGIVSDATTGAPLPGVRVEVDSTGSATTTDTRGFFYFEGLPPGSINLRASAQGFEVASVSTTVPPPGRSDLLEAIGFELTRLGDAEAVSRLPKMWEEPRRVVRIDVSGRLRLEDGEPAAYTMVKIDGKEAITDGDGFYVVKGLAPGEHRLEALLPHRGWVAIEGEREAASKRKTGSR